MKTRKIKDSEKALFTEIQALKSQGFWSDHIRLEEVMITANRCPRCHYSLVYQGWSNLTIHLGFGICEDCQFAKRFFYETAEVSGFMKKVCEAVKRTA